MGEAGNIIAAERSTGSYFYNKDMRGSTTTILDGVGNNKVSYEYTDFGESTAKGDFYNEICYTGGIYDNTTGLYYLNARYYNPDDGRFVTQDTYRGDMNNPSSLHLYAYCANNPVNYVDPSGHVPMQLSVAMYLYALEKHKGVQKFRNGFIGGTIAYTFANSSSFKSELKKNKKKGEFKLKNFNFPNGNSFDMDLRLSLGHITIQAKYKNASFWWYKRYSVTLMMYDIYDFAKFGKNEKNRIKRWVNDYLGYYPQKLGAIKPYDWNYSGTIMVFL